MDHRRDGVAFLGDSAQYGLKQMLPECFVSVKLETYEDSSCSESQQYPPVQTSPDSAGANAVLNQDLSPKTEASQHNSDTTKAQTPHVIYQVQLLPSSMQQAQPGNQPQPSQGASQPSQLSHVANSTHVPQVSSSVNRPTSQQSSQAPPPHQFSQTHPRPTEIAWLSHTYVDQNNQHFHAHQMQYVPNDAALLSSIPATENGARIVKQNSEDSGEPSSMSCRTGNNPGNTSSVPANDSGESSSFISYVLNPQRGVPPPGIFLFDSSRGHTPQGSQLQDNNREADSHNSVQGGSSVDETIRESSSDSANTVESSKPGECHLVSRSCQTIVTMSQIQDAPLMPDTKIIIVDAPVPEVTPEREDSKDRVFTEADGEDSEEGSSIDSESECENLKQVTRLGSNCSEFGGQTRYSLQHGTHSSLGRQCQVCLTNESGQLHNGIEGVPESSSSQGVATHNKTIASSIRRNNDIVGTGIFPFVESDRPFRCDICGNAYTSQQGLVNHERYHRGERPYECEVCHKAFATNSHLVTHRRTHTGERPFQCQLCQRCFADRSAFVKHERTHGPNGSIIKRYKCDECGSGFVDSCGLKKHIRIHTGERPYVCNVCSKTFSTSSTFVAHKRIHTGERPYKCESCDKMFITKSHLLTHRRTHTGEKPFTCSVCHRCFTDGSSFRRHERLHTGENRHICMQCGRGFPLESSLLKHKQTHVQSGTFSYVYENRNDLNCISSPQQQQDNCEITSDRPGRLAVSQVRENVDGGICVDLSRDIPGEVQVNGNSLCAEASREIDCDNQSALSTVRVVG